MLRTRLIPVLLLQNGLLVRSESFREYQVLGNPIHEAKRFNEWNVDELIYLDISREGSYDLRREDHRIRDLDQPMQILEAVSKTCFMPLTWGGRIRTIEDMRACFRHGADKIAINSEAFRDPELIRRAAQLFGRQAIVVSIDALRHPDGRHEVFIEGGREPTGVSPAEWARRAVEAGAGELLVQSIDCDGTARGYDVGLIRDVSGVSSVPVIALGGVGRYEHYVDGIRAGADAVAAANIFHFKELSDRNAKRTMSKAGVHVRS